MRDPYGDYGPTKRQKIAIGGAVLLVLLVVLGLFVTASVPAQNVGVVTTFGKTNDRNLKPGLHFKLPWQKVTDMDGTIQQLNNIGLNATGEPDEPARERGRTPVKLNDNSIMFVDNTLRWKIRTDAASDLFKDWGKGGGSDIVEKKVNDGKVAVELASALNIAVAPYDPLNPTAAGQSYDELAAKVVTNLVGADGKSGRIGNQIEVVSFNILGVNFDEKTQERIRQYAEEVQKTRIATQQAKTNVQVKKAYEELEGLYKDPAALRNKCLDVAKENGSNLPASYTCYPAGAQPVVEAK